MYLEMSLWKWFLVFIGCNGLCEIYCQEKKLDQFSAFEIVNSGCRPAGKSFMPLGSVGVSREQIWNRIQFTQDLYRLGRRVGMDSRYKQLDRSACIRIRKLRLNRRGKRGGRRSKVIHIV